MGIRLLDNVVEKLLGKVKRLPDCQIKNWVRNHVDQPVSTPLTGAQTLGRFNLKLFTPASLQIFPFDRVGFGKPTGSSKFVST